ncbi:MAG: hypothetical protein V3T31_00435, partial [candidate division Zixibacteria bacterium]
TATFQTPDQQSVQIDISGLAAGQHNGFVIFTSAQAANSPETLFVQVDIYSGAENAISLANTTGIDNDTIYIGSPVQWQLRLQTACDIGTRISGFSNGFQIKSPDGAFWTNAAGAFLPDWTSTTQWSETYVNLFGITGNVADTVTFAGFTILESGMPPGYDQVGWSVSIDVPSNPSLHGKTICLDSVSNFQPFNVWMWNDISKSNIPPTWDGPHCYILIDSTMVDSIVTFPDPGLEAAIRDEIPKPTGDIYLSEVLLIDSLNAETRNIADLTGLQVLVNLNRLELMGNQITDLTPLMPLSSLTILDLYNNLVTELTPLSSLGSLTYLRLGANQVSNVTPLSVLTSLNTLMISSGQIVNIGPLSTLVNLTYLRLDYNDIVDLSPIGLLPNLTQLHMFGNQITNLLPIVNLTTLTHLGLGDNQISNLAPLTSLPNLNRLFIWDNSVTDLSVLVNHTGIATGDHIYVATNPLSDFAILNQIGSLRAKGAIVHSDYLMIPDTLYFAADSGAALPPSDLLLMIEAGGDSAVTFTLTHSIPWLNLSLSFGTTPEFITANANSTILPPGSYFDSVQVTSINASNAPGQVYVSYIVTAPAPASPNAISLANAIGAEGNEIGIGESIEWQLSFKVGPDVDTKISGYTNGFHIMSPDGATWLNAAGGYLPAWDNNSAFDQQGINLFGADGSGADTLGFFGFTIFSNGALPSFNQVSWSITADIPNDAGLIGKTICLDSVGVFPPANPWKWNDGAALELFPSWDGPHCYTITGASAAELVASPPLFSFTMIEGGANPATQQINISELGGSAIAYSCDTTALFLTLSHSAGVTPDLINVSINGTGLPTGVHPASISINSAGAVNSPLIVPVSLTVNPAPLPTTSSMSLDSISGRYGFNSIVTGQEVEFFLRMTTDDRDYPGITNAYRVYSPDGASWSTTTIDTMPLGWPNYFAIGTFLDGYSTDGSGSDTVGASAISFFTGFPPGSDQLTHKITVGPISSTFAGQTLCIDSASYIPGYQWAWQDIGFEFVYPNWSGPHCFTIVDTAGLAFCGDANQDSTVNIADAVYLTNYLWLGGSSLGIYNNANVDNCDAVDAADLGAMTDFLFMNFDPMCTTVKCPAPANDLGTRDSLLLDYSVYAGSPPGRTVIQVDLIAFHDANTNLTTAAGFQWQHSALVLDSAVVGANQTFNNLFMYEDNNITTSNNNDRFIIGGWAIFGTGLPQSSTRSEVARYYFHIDDWNDGSQVVIDTATYSDGTVYKQYSTQGVYQPVWGGPITISKPSTTANAVIPAGEQTAIRPSGSSATGSL